MIESSKSIIDHIPDFLDYCEIEKGLSDITQKDYKRYLNRFVLWLKKIKKEDLKPHELTTDDIWQYRLYLSRFHTYKGKPLEKITQNLYLIALRALLSYFTDKDIVSIPFDKIKLPKYKREKKTVRPLTLTEIERLLSAPNIKKKIGLRDRAILDTIIHTGLKVSQIVDLNREQIEIDNYYIVDKSNKIHLPKEALDWIKKYLDTRRDKSKALFIHYRSRKGVENRLTPRSIQRIVKKYGREINLPFSITPEILRWAYARALLNEQNQPKIIHKAQTHKNFVVEKYRYITNARLYKQTTQQISPLWHVIENIINKEILWLKNNIPVLPEGYKNNPLSLSDDYILRKIAILIVSGEVKATKFRAKGDKDLWYNLTKRTILKKTSYHGQEWHRKMMDVIYEYFNRNYRIVWEPILHYGRADLGVYINPNKIIYIEIGTISLYKIWHNLSSMKNIALLIIPSEESAIEFKV